MSFNFGQFRRSQVNNYLTPITNYDMVITEVESATSASMKFADKTLQLNNGFLKPTGNNNIQQSYFIRFKIFKRPDGKQIINVKLNNTTKIEDNIQNIKQIEIPTGGASEAVTFEIIISPNSDYDQVQFILNRDGTDMSIGPGSSSQMSPSELGDYYGRVIKIEIENFSSIYNIIEKLSGAIGGKNRLKQIGIQGPVGLLMNINGESIRIGRTGIYEINNGVIITSIGFIIENDTDNFILDYQY